MIHNQDRSKWFGASDTSMIMGNWNTKTFQKWWLVKLGISQNHFTTLSMKTGTAYEHRILDALNIEKRDRQTRKRKYRLRVNLDGETREEITEVKTYRDKFKVSKAYWQQCQVEMLAAHKKCRIAAYRLNPEDYSNWFNEIDLSRISFFPIEHDPNWIKSEYLPRLKYLSKCLRKGAVPDEREIA